MQVPCLNFQQVIHCLLILLIKSGFSPSIKKRTDNICTKNKGLCIYQNIHQVDSVEFGLCMCDKCVGNSFCASPNGHAVKQYYCSNL